MNISFDKLRYFVEVAKREHIGNTAKAINISPSVLSESIKQLEIELGKKLFIRSKRNITLSQEGLSFLPKAQAVLDSVFNLYQKESNALNGEFSFGISLSLFKYGPVDIKKITSTIAKNTNFCLNINTSDTGRLVDLVLSGHLDAALVYSPIKHEDLIEELVQETSFHIALKKNHPIFSLSKKEQIQELNNLPAIGFKASVGHNLCLKHPMFDRLGINPKYQYYYDVDQVAVELTQKTNGWIFTSQNIIDGNKSKLKALEAHKDLNVPMHISLIRKRQKVEHAFLKKLKESFIK